MADRKSFNPSYTIGVRTYCTAQVVVFDFPDPDDPIEQRGADPMKIGIDLHHNPMRGTVDCTGCGAPIVHMSDDWHDFLADQVARARGEVYNKQDPFKRTPAAWYPAMAEKAAEMLAGKVTAYLFCHYCGKALEQPVHSWITDAPALPKPYGNTFKAAARWAEEMGKAGLPVGDYHKWNNMAYEQRQRARIIWAGR